jgi:hypothetical protein
MRQIPNSSKNPAIELLPDPKGLDRVVQTLQEQFTTGLPWLEKAFGRAYTQSVKTDIGVGIRSNDNIFYPAVYQGYSGDNVRDFENVLENDNLDSYCFFKTEDDLSQEYSHFLENEFESEFSIIFLFDMDRINKRLGTSRLYPFQNELIADALEQIELTVFSTVGDRVTVNTVQKSPQEIFRGYTIDITERQNLVYPSGGFKINLTAQWLQECF